ncbi:aminomethyltransferase [Synechococcus sp. 60AY4M2]|uniref:CAF17-like 4Fe-4S cluster assembly/insertion protein YgfZ n=1 Tax=unclassified Synechococcus TaxID=2626047 RepID=UPI000C1A2B74|nr:MULTISPECIES: folate-binding protein YgfZ [unclassified Synechococcus]PIK94381.1 aminomethyltransferase [Synechococcus sp. 60AY4M2]PIK98962.1 aminomethyltransferase [Synechococcus sp. 63AY4M1]PIL00322.1 aminomethyltransferase [Synechococcus sp. 65AY640]
MSLLAAVSTEGQPVAQTGSLLLDRSGWGRLRMKGSPGLDYLHNQSTQNLKALQPGQGADTVFVTPTAGILDLATVYVGEEDCWIWTSPQRRSLLMQSLGRMLPLVRGAQLKDETDQTFGFGLLGPQSQALLEQVVSSEEIPTRLNEHCAVEIQGIPVHLACGTGLAQPGFTLWGTIDQKVALEECLLQAGAKLAPPELWEVLRLEAGRPAADRELTSDYNPLEAGLWRAVSLDKGCYVGQEVLAKQVTYRRIRQTLWGIRLQGEAQPGTEILRQGEKIGLLTSAGLTSQGYLGLGYVRTKFNPAEGLEVEVGSAPGVLTRMPFSSFPPIV